MKVSFDYDNTLTRTPVFNYAKELVKSGVELWIVTARFDNPSHDPLDKDYDNYWLFENTNELGIARDHIIFTGLKDKSEFFNVNKDFIFHLDDTYEEISKINKYTNVTGVWLLQGHDWKETCNKLLNKE